MCDFIDDCQNFKPECIGKSCFRCYLPGRKKKDKNPQAGSEAVSAELALLTDKVKALFKELDEKHHLAETEYLRNSSQYQKGKTMALSEVCSKLMVILN